MDKNPCPQDEETRFTLRISSKLFEKIKAEAAAEKRSAAKQIEFILERWIEEHNSKE